VAHLARKGPVHGLRAVGPAPGERPDRTVPAMADRYAALVAELPEPPNLLVGWSLGGLLAWETARRLPGPAPDLVLIDSSPGPWDARPDAYRAARAHVLREAAAQLGPDAYRRTAATVDAHVAARRGHRAAGLHPGRALVVACTRGDSPGQAGEWAPLVDDLTVCSLDADHFGALSGEPLRRLTALIDAFAGARRPVRVR
jgi:thioesterase domain-containing protein